MLVGLLGSLGSLVRLSNAAGSSGIAPRASLGTSIEPLGVRALHAELTPGPQNMASSSKSSESAASAAAWHTTPAPAQACCAPNAPMLLLLLARPLGLPGAAVTKEPAPREARCIERGVVGRLPRGEPCPEVHVQE